MIYILVSNNLENLMDIFGRLTGRNSKSFELVA
jgi:hypothetical protein